MGSDFTRFRMATREKIEQLERENAALREHIANRVCLTCEWKVLLEAQELENAKLKEELRREIHADTTRLEWLLSHKGRTWFCRSIENGEWIGSMGDVRGFIDTVRKLQA